MTSAHRLASGTDWDFHLKLVGKVALIFAAAATAGLVALLHAVDIEGGTGYGSIIGTQLRSAGQLAIGLWVFGLLLAALSGMTTWLLALYASFRIAGPMFRFARNIERAIRRGPVAPIPVRRDDQLQRDSRELREAIDALEVHYRVVRQALEECRPVCGTASGEAILSRMRDLDARVRL